MIETYGEKLNSIEECIELINEMHTLTMESCGALEDDSKNSEALEFMGKVLKFAYENEYSEGDES